MTQVTITIEAEDAQIAADFIGTKIGSTSGDQLMPCVNLMDALFRAVREVGRD